MASLKSGEKETAFPWALAEETFQLIRDRGIRVIRYRDLDLKAPLARSSLRYIGEYTNFKYGKVTPLTLAAALLQYWSIRKRLYRNRLLSKLIRQDRPPTLILEHDADRFPERTLAMMKLESSYGLRSSNFFFAEHADQWERYEIDAVRLKELEAMGFEVGYHQNAFERANYDEKTALELVSKDLSWLGARFSIQSFVPHGGCSSVDGRNNLNLGHRGDLQSLLWAYNGSCVLKEFTWSDGGITSCSPIDPRDFLRSLPMDSRAMMLMHPQYYGSELRVDWERLPLAKVKWWRSLWGM